MRIEDFQVTAPYNDGTSVKRILRRVRNIAVFYLSLILASALAVFLYYGIQAAISSRFMMSYFWIISLTLKFVLCFLIISRRLIQRVPAFSYYILFGAANSVVLWYVYAQGSTYDSQYSTLFWVSQSLLAPLQYIVVVETCRRILRGYPGTWGLAWRVLVWSAGLIVLDGVTSLWGGSNSVAHAGFVVRRAFELGAFATISLILMMIHHYGIRVAFFDRLIGLGLGVNSFTEIIYTFVRDYIPYMANAVLISSVIVLGIWCYASVKGMPLRDNPTEEASQDGWGERTAEVRVGFLVVEEWSKAFLKRLGIDVSSSA